jgi:hypothetical protein
LARARGARKPPPSESAGNARAAGPGPSPSSSSPANGPGLESKAKPAPARPPAAPSQQVPWAFPRCRRATRNLIRPPSRSSAGGPSSSMRRFRRACEGPRRRPAGAAAQVTQFPVTVDMIAALGFHVSTFLKHGHEVTAVTVTVHWYSLWEVGGVESVGLVARRGGGGSAGPGAGAAAPRARPQPARAQPRPTGRLTRGLPSWPTVPGATGRKKMSA